MRPLAKRRAQPYHLNNAETRCSTPHIHRGASAILTGARPLPPEALQAVFRYICHPDTPPVMRSWAFALAFSAVSSIRRINAQHLVFYGELVVHTLSVNTLTANLATALLVYLLPLSRTRMVVSPGLMSDDKGSGLMATSSGPRAVVTRSLPPAFLSTVPSRKLVSRKPFSLFFNKPVL